MARIVINQEVLNGIEPLASAPSDEFRAFLNQLQSAISPSLSVEDWLNTYLQKVELPPPFKSADQLTDVLLGVHYLRLGPLTDDELLHEVLAAATDAWEEDKEKDLGLLQTNLHAILSIEALQASTKGVSLLADQERVFLTSKVITDVRPVYGADLKAPMLATVITHTLKISARVDGRSQSWYFALDSEDLVQLRETIERAVTKDKLLTEQVRGGGAKFGPPLEILRIRP